MNSSLEYARKYASLGLNVIPVRRDMDPNKDKRPVLSRWEQYQKRMATEAEISDWFDEGKNNNIAIICGSISGNLAVIDFDDPRAFAFVFRQGIEALSEKTPVVLTGKGVHVYVRVVKSFAKTTYQKKNQNQKNWIPVDIQCEGSYVVAPPSLHLRKEKTYSFVKEPTGFIVTTEENLKEDFEKAAEQWPIALTFIENWTDGSKHNSALGFAGFMRKKLGYSLEEAKELMDRICHVKFGEEMDADLDRILEDAYKKESDKVAIGAWLGEELTRTLGSLAPKKKKKNDVIVQSSTRFPLSDYQSVTWDPTGIKLESENAGGVTRWQQVIKGYVKPISKLNVDGDLLFEYELANDERRITKVDALFKDLKGRGMVFNQYHALNSLSAVSDGIASPNEKFVHATFGIYPNHGKAVLCENPVAIKPEQMKAWEQIKPFLSQDCEQADLLNYIKLLSFWHPYEILPIFGLSLVAPFTPILRRRGILVPHAYSYSPESDVGKSTICMAYSKYLWEIDPTTGPALSSEFRLASAIDSICLPVCVEEADRINAKQWPTLKDSAERWLADKRGTQDLGMLVYSSRAILLFTGNAMPISAGPVIKRFLIIRFDSSAIRKRRAKSEELDNLIRELSPIGFQILRWQMERYKTEDEIILEIRKLEREIRKLTKNWKSPKRPEAWACVYFGLEIFENACRRLGVDWSPPTIEEFYEKVIVPIETSSWDMKRSNIERFKSWFQSYLVDKSRWTKQEDGTRWVNPGEGILYKADRIEINKENGIEGYWITDSLLDQFNDDMEDESRIPSLKELATQSADFDKLPYDKVMEGKEGQRQSRVVRFYDGKSRRAAFIVLYEVGQKPCNIVTTPLPDDATNDENADVTDVTDVTMLQTVTNDCNKSQEAIVTRLQENEYGGEKKELQDFYQPCLARYDPPILTFQQCKQLFGDRDWKVEFKVLTRSGHIEVLATDKEPSFKWIEGDSS